jgi:hypothetical protein
MESQRFPLDLNFSGKSGSFLITPSNQHTKRDDFNDLVTLSIEKA